MAIAAWSELKVEMGYINAASRIRLAASGVPRYLVDCGGDASPVLNRDRIFEDVLQLFDDEVGSASAMPLYNGTRDLPHRPL